MCLTELRIALLADLMSQYLLTASKDCAVVLHSVKTAEMHHAKMPATALAVGSTQIAFVLDPIDRDFAFSKTAPRKPDGACAFMCSLCSYMS